MDRSAPAPRSYLFTVRMWKEDLGDGRAEWRGKVQRITNGEAYYFRAWEQLIELLQNMLPEESRPGQAE